MENVALSDHPDRPVSPARLRRDLSSLGVLFLTLSALSPVFSVYGLGGDVLQHTGTGAAALFIGAIGAALVWAALYAELGSAYPYAGGDYVGIGRILGPWAAFASLTIWAVTGGPYAAFMAKTIGVYVHDMLPAVPSQAVTYGSIAAALAVALLSVRASALVTGIFLAVEMLAILALIAAGAAHPARSLGSTLHPLVLDASGMLVPPSLGALALGGITAVFATMGGNQAIAFGEEIPDPHRRIGPIVLLAALIGALGTALPVVFAVIGSGDLVGLLKSPAPFSTFIASIAGPAAGRALSACVALAVFNALIAQIMFCGRLFFSLGRDGIFNPLANRLLSSVHARSGAPRGATLVLGAFGAACCLLDSHVLAVLSSGLVIFCLALSSSAILVGRSKRLTGIPGFWRAPLHPLAPLLGLLLALVFLVAGLRDPEAGRPSILFLAGCIAASLLWHALVLQRRPGGWTPRVDSPDIPTNAQAQRAS
ncbi:MAG TPA: APC family permease [Steroidobacteraceae bacterium]|nr:APC family permease [Steroidobacteraceae bacterium]